jgi:UDP-N-acetylglucosamine 1-carboxyvinyltransferase
MNGTYVIIGGNKLKGSVTPIPNKNSLMGALPLAVIAEKGFGIIDLPDTSDVNGFLEIFRSIEIETAIKDKTTFFDSSRLDTSEILSDRGKTFRGSFSLAGPLLARFGKAKLWIPGGCKLGTRSISTHVNGFRELGIEVKESGSEVLLVNPKKRTKRQMVWLTEASVTTTISIATFAAGSDGEIEIRNAACEPHVCDILYALQDLGATIEGIGSNHLYIKGTSNFKKAVFKASPDYVDVSGYCVAAAVSKGKIRIVQGNKGNNMLGIAKWFSYFNLNITFEGDDILADGARELEIQYEKFPKAGHDLPKLAVAPWPGFPVDVLPVIVTLATKAKGRILFQNWMYESGFDYIRELAYMGAEIYMSDPQRIIVMEPRTQYKGGIVVSPGIIQGTKAIFLAALSEPVKTTLHGTDILKRRYPNILDTYKRLGANLTELK